MITIQKAEPKDAPEIKRLLRVTWNEAYSSMYSTESIEAITSEWHKLEFLIEQIQAPKILFLIAKDGNKIIAISNTDRVENDELINIQRLHVLPEYQSQGIGTRLTDEIVKRFPRVKKLQLEVEKQNYRAISFYEKRGFKKVGEKIFEVASVKMPSLVMEKTV